mgnify:FL=1|jgi:hypothetical protein
MNNTDDLWIDTRLSEEEMKFLNDAISEKNKENHSDHLAGNISKSELIEDKDNWFFESSLKKLIEKKEKSQIEKLKLEPFWVNYQKQNEFNPLHNHSGLYSFVVFMKIPTHWKEQHALPLSTVSNFPCASDFCFHYPEKDNNIYTTYFKLSPEDEGRMLFFPAGLAHQVYPFYGTEEERITISGNISNVQESNWKKILEEGARAIEENAKFMKELRK